MGGMMNLLWLATVFRNCIASRDSWGEGVLRHWLATGAKISIAWQRIFARKARGESSVHTILSLFMTFPNFLHFLLPFYTHFKIQLFEFIMRRRIRYCFYNCKRYYYQMRFPIHYIFQPICQLELLTLFLSFTISALLAKIFAAWFIAHNWFCSVTGRSCRQKLSSLASQ